jgi:hypothetical protein
MARIPDELHAMYVDGWRFVDAGDMRRRRVHESKNRVYRRWHGLLSDTMETLSESIPHFHCVQSPSNQCRTNGETAPTAPGEPML